jgi:hypothetical protein
MKTYWDLIILFSLLGAILISQEVVEAAPVQWAGNGHWYEAVLTPAGISWQAASDAANAAGGYLATTTSAEENDFVYGLVSGNDAFWFKDQYGTGLGPMLGGFQPAGSPEPGSGWRWVTDEPFVYTKWGMNQPDNFGGAENYLHFGAFGGPLKAPTWNDLPQNALMRGYIIEYNVSPLAGAISGTVTLQGRTSNRGSVDFELRQPGTTVIVPGYQPAMDLDSQTQGVQVYVPASGAYSLTEIPAGTYDLAAKASAYLRKVQAGIVVTKGGNVSNVNFSLMGGDINDTNNVNILDLNILKGTYGKSGAH